MGTSNIRHNFRAMELLARPQRSCGECQMCCKLVPVRELNKGTNVKCPHQSRAAGCKVYPTRPMSCSAWDCAWLRAAGMDFLKRPDRSRYVVDIFYDFLSFEGKNPVTVEALQVYASKSDIDTILRDKGLLRLIEDHARRRIVTLIRCSEEYGVVVVHPMLHPGEDLLRIELSNNENTHVEFDFIHLDADTSPPNFDDLQKTVETLFPEEKV